MSREQNMKVRDTVKITVTSKVDGSGREVKRVRAEQKNGPVERGQKYHPDVLAKAIALWGVDEIDHSNSSYYDIARKQVKK